MPPESSGYANNFHDAGLHAREIDAVVVSHNHTDHNQDLRSLDDICYELYKRADDAGRDQWKYVLVWDEDSEANVRLDPDPAAHRAPGPFRFDMQRLRDLGDNAIDLTPAGLPFTVKYFDADHGNDVPNAVGLRIECHHDDPNAMPVSVGFTCDTKYYGARCDEDHLHGCDILVAHVSQPEVRELQNPDCLKTNDPHLGLNGVAKLIEGAKPKLTILGEFWAGLADLRIDLAQALRERTGSDGIIPGGLGLLVDPATRKVKCTACPKWVPGDEVSVAAPALPFGALSYVCPECRL